MEHKNIQKLNAWIVFHPSPVSMAFLQLSICWESLMILSFRGNAWDCTSVASWAILLRGFSKNTKMIFPFAPASKIIPSCALHLTQGIFNRKPIMHLRVDQCTKVDPSFSLLITLIKHHHTERILNTFQRIRKHILLSIAQLCLSYPLNFANHLNDNSTDHPSISIALIHASLTRMICVDICHLDIFFTVLFQWNLLIFAIHSRYFFLTFCIRNFNLDLKLIMIY